MPRCYKVSSITVSGSVSKKLEEARNRSGSRCGSHVESRHFILLRISLLTLMSVPYIDEHLTLILFFSTIPLA